MSSFTPINRQPQQSQSSYLSFNDMLNPVSEQIQSTSSSSAMAQPTTKKYLCAVEGCGKGYGQNIHLKRHEDSAHNNIRKFCPKDDCNRSFSDETTLKRHINKDHENLMYICPIENQSFTKPTGFNDHIKRKHPNEKFDSSTNYLQKV